MKSFISFLFQTEQPNRNFNVNYKAIKKHNGHSDKLSDMPLYNDYAN